MMRRNSAKEDVEEKNIDDSWLGINIFWTRCTSKGNVCQVIVLGGSCENIISKEMVQKLNLQCKKNPQSYQIAWFKK